MSREQRFLETVDRTRRNLFKAGSTMGAAALALLFGSGTKKAFGSVAVCFLKGTRIMTAAGEEPVEALGIGSRLPTMFGGVRPIHAVTRQTIRKAEGSRSWHEKQMLVKIAGGALAQGIPSRDLYVTRAHSIHIDGVLVPAVQLVNGTTVTLFAPECDEFEIYHVKLESHDVIHAEGAPCETLLADAADETCVPVLYFDGKRSEVRSRLRSALSLFVDRREKIDILRDHLEEHGVFEARPFSG